MRLIRLYILGQFKYFTPLNILIGTPFGRLTRYLRVTLLIAPSGLSSAQQERSRSDLSPINELKGNPPMEDCSISNLHRCINNISIKYKYGIK